MGIKHMNTKRDFRNELKRLLLIDFYWELFHNTKSKKERRKILGEILAITDAKQLS